MSSGRLFGELVGKVDGPILVIGGGPTAPTSLEALKARGFAPAAVLSANEHGFKQSAYPVTHSVCLDGRHGEKKIAMETLLRSYGAQPIIATGYFGDFRLPEWNLVANSGLTAIAVAVFMGGHPVVVVGIDFYRFGPASDSTYFHDQRAASNSNGKAVINFRRQCDALVAWIGARAPVRTLPEWPVPFRRFPKWDPEEIVGPKPLPPRARHIQGMTTVMVRCRTTNQPVSFVNMNVEPGRVWPCSINEARGVINARHASFVEAFPPPGSDELLLPPDLVRARHEDPSLPAILRRAPKRG